MTPAGIRGMGAPSARTEARKLHSQGWRPERIAAFLDEDPNVISELIYGKVKPKPKRQQGVSPASPEQRAKVKGKACIRCRRPGPCDPAHLIDRSLASYGADDERAVVALCRQCHTEYDEQDISLLEVLEPHFREELAFAVERVGLLTALNRISGDRWQPTVTGGPE